MKLKPRAARRLLLVGVAGMLLVVAVFGVFVVRKWQNQRRTQILREDGMAAYMQQDYPATLDNLGRFLRRQADDREAWLAFADAREKLEEPRGAHLMQAAAAYARALSLDESDRDTAMKLLKLQNLIGYSAEARDLAVRLRPADLSAATEKDVEVLIQEAGARLALKAYDQTLDQVTARLIEIAPKNYQAALMRTSYLREADRRDEARAFASDLAKANPGDGRFEIVELLVRIEGGEQLDVAKFAATFCRVAGLDPDTGNRIKEPAYTDIQLAGQLFAGFDRLGMPMHALAVIRDGAVRLADPDFRRLLARRLWESGQPDTMLTDFAAVDTGPRGDPSDTIAFRALALRSLGRADDAKALIAALRARDRDFLARAWSGALTAVIETADPKESLSQIDAAIKEHPGEPAFLHFRGEALWRLGRADEARAAWESVYGSDLVAGWEAPSVRIAETLLDEGRLEEGMVAATNALQRFRLSPAARLVHLRAQALMIESGRPVQDPAAVLTQIEETSARLESLGNASLSLLSRRALLPAQVSLLSDAGRREDAIALLERIAADTQTLDADLARRLAQVSTREGLGMEDRILAAAGQSGAGEGTLVSRALLLHSSGKADEATKLIDDAFAAATESQKAELAAARAQFRDAIGHPEALATWKAAVQAHPESLSLQLAAIRSESAASDPAFVEQLAAQIIKLGGSDADRPSADIRFARARTLLHKSPTSRQRDDAVAILRALVLESPARSDFRDAMIAALLLDDPSQNVRPNYQGAIDQLTAAAAFSSDRTSFTLRLASIYQQQGRTAEAVAELTKLALDTSADSAGRLRAVDRLGELREHEAALRGLDAIIGSSREPSTDMLLRRGALLLALRRDREASETYQRILQQPIDSAQTILSIAGALRTLGENAAADAAIAKLDNPAIPPKDRALARAGFAAATGDAAAALAEYTRATEIAPDERQTWGLLARFHLLRGEVKEAEAAATRGLERLPGDSELTIIREQIRIAAMGEENMDIEGLADALSRNPATARRGEAIRAISRARTEGKLDDIAALVRIADEFADDPSTQIFVARQLAVRSSTGLNEAARIMRRASGRYPNDPAVQELATQTLIAAADWEAALASATAWRALTRQSEADVAIGEVQLAIGRPRQAFDAVKDLRLPAAIADDDRLSLGILNVRVRASIKLGNAAGALQLLQPTLVGSSVARTAIALPAAAELLESAADVRSWIELVASRMVPPSPDDQMAVAIAWATAADRLPDARSDFYKRALAAIDPLMADESTATARVFGLRSSILESSGDRSGAIAAARLALEREPQNPGLMLTLARLLIGPGGDAAEAEAVALQAAAAAPSSPDPLLTAAQAQLAQSNGRARASESLKKLIALGATDAGTVLAIANLADTMDEVETAIRYYELGLASPTPPSGLNMAIAKNNLAYRLLKLPRTSASDESLRRAKTLIDDAIRLAQLAPFYDTLGSIDIAMGDRTGAIEAFRRAIAIDPSPVGPKLNLAEVLASGTPAEKEEAARMIGAIDPAAQPTLSAEQREQLGRIRSQIGG